MGSPFNDYLLADRKKVSAVYGMEGDDDLQSGQTKKKHYLYGGDGNDDIQSGINALEVDGGSGNDWISSTLAKNQAIRGGPGSDVIRVYAAPGKKAIENIIINGGEGDDIINYKNANTKALNIKIISGEGNDKIYYETYSSNGLTNIQVGDGDDIIYFQRIPPGGTTEVSGDSGTDAVRFYSWEKEKLVSAARESDDRVLLTFAAYTLKGVGYTQQITLNSVEEIYFGDSVYAV